MSKHVTSGYRYVVNDPRRPAGFPLLILTDGSFVSIQRQQRRIAETSPFTKRWRRWGDLARRAIAPLAEMTYREWYYHPIDSVRYEYKNRRIFCYAQNQIIPLYSPNDLFEITLFMGDLIFERLREHKMTSDRSLYVECYREVRHVHDVAPNDTTTGHSPKTTPEK